MQFSRVLALTVVFGIVLIIIGIFGLSWVECAQADAVTERMTSFQREPAIQEILRLAPAIQTALGIESTFDPNRIETVFSDSNKQQLIALIHSGRRLTGWVLWRHVPPLGRSLYWSIALTLACTALDALTLLVLALTVNAAIGKRLLLFSFIATIFTLILLLIQLPGIDTFGQIKDLSMAFLSFLLGAQTRAGVYVVLTGLALAAMGLVMLFMSITETRTTTDETVF